MSLNLLKNKLILVLVLLTAGTLSSFCQHDVTTLNVVEDVYISEQEPSTNMNGITDLGVAIDETNGDSRETYLKFDISDLTGKGGLVSAELSIMASVKNEAPWHTVDNFDIVVYGCTNPWSESTLTWDTKVEADPEIIAEKGIQQMERFIITGTDADATSLKKYIEEAMKKHWQYVSFVIKGKEETPGARIWISDKGWEPAKLIITQDYLLTEPGAIEVFIESIAVTGEDDVKTITSDNGTLQMTANVLPEDASLQRVKWSVINETGKATISETGLLTAIADGTVTVIADAIDGSWAQGTVEVSISNQVYTYDERNIIVDGTFENDDKAWYGDHVILEGNICAITSNMVYPNCWDYAFNQVLKVPYDKKDLDYVFAFKAWADEERTFNVDMEDFNNGYARYGISDDPRGYGLSDWTFDLTTTPTMYIFDVNFSPMMENCSQNLKFNIGLSTVTVYLDSVSLMTKSDYEGYFTTEVSDVYNNSLKVYPNPVGASNEIVVSMAEENQRVAIYNLAGQKLMEKLANDKIARFNVSNLRKGMYVVRINNGTSLKFVK